MVAKAALVFLAIGHAAASTDPKSKTEVEVMALGGVHYDKPPCLSDEVKLDLKTTPGAGQPGGQLCASPCYPRCPSDKPPNTTATPECRLHYSSGRGLCALACSFSSSCPSGAFCAFPLGVCVFPDVPPSGSEHVTNDSKVVDEEQE